MDLTQRRITKIAREVHKFTTRTLKADGIGSGEFDFIHVVRHNPGITQAGVCKQLGTDKGAAARQTARLEAKGYLIRKMCQEDKRSALLYATEKSERLKNSKTSVETAFYEWLLEPLSATDRVELARLLEIVYQRCKTESRAEFPHMTRRMEEGRLL